MHETDTGDINIHFQGRAGDTVIDKVVLAYSVEHNAVTQVLVDAIADITPLYASSGDGRKLAAAFLNKLEALFDALG